MKAVEEMWEINMTMTIPVSLIAAIAWVMNIPDYSEVTESDIERFLSIITNREVARIQERMKAESGFGER
jgi:hypothetical protein